MTSFLDEPHHDGSVTCTAPGAHRLGDTVPVRVRVPSVPGRAGRDAGVVLRSVRDGEPTFRVARVDGSDETGAWFVADLPVDNPVTSYRFLVDPDRDYRWLTARGVARRDVSDAGDFRISVFDPPPDWVADQVVYQVFPDRFARSGRDHAVPEWAVPAAWDDPVVHQGRDAAHQWFGGDLDGVVEHLDHLTGLGATVLYLTPIFEGRSNHRYDAVTFDRIDPVLGGDEAFGRLLAAAHARGLRALGDLTLNHTGVAHEWFRAAVADAAAPESAYYRFGRHPDEYASWLGVPSLPKQDHRSEAMRTALYEGPGSAVARWLDNKGKAETEVAYRPSRVLMQDFTGVPAVVDLAAMRDAMTALDGDPDKINPLVPVDLVIDHSVIVDEFGTPKAFDKNVELEYARNGER